MINIKNNSSEIIDGLSQDNRRLLALKYGDLEHNQQVLDALLKQFVKKNDLQFC